MGVYCRVQSSSPVKWDWKDAHGVSNDRDQEMSQRYFAQRSTPLRKKPPKTNRKSNPNPKAKKICKINQTNFLISSLMWLWNPSRLQGISYGVDKRDIVCSYVYCRDSPLTHTHTHTRARDARSHLLIRNPSRPLYTNYVKVFKTASHKYI